MYLVLRDKKHEATGPEADRPGLDLRDRTDLTQKQFP